MGANFDPHLFRLLVFTILTRIVGCLILNFWIFLNFTRILLKFRSFFSNYREKRRAAVIILICNNRRYERGSFVVILVHSSSFIAWWIPITHFRIFLIQFHNFLIKQLSGLRISGIVVCSLVSGQIRALCESFIAISKAAFVGLLTSMCSNMCFQIKI